MAQGLKLFCFGEVLLNAKGYDGRPALIFQPRFFGTKPMGHPQVSRYKMLFQPREEEKTYHRGIATRI
jgi:hypothetical protein